MKHKWFSILFERIKIFGIIIVSPILYSLKFHKLTEEEWLKEVGDTIQHVYGWNGSETPYKYLPIQSFNQVPKTRWEGFKDKILRR